MLQRMMDGASYELRFKRQALTALRRVPRQDAQRILRELNRLAENPERRDIDVVPLVGRPGFRLRVSNRRAIFERDDAARIIDVLLIAPRGEAYRS